MDNETQPDSGEENAWLTRFVERLAASYDDLTALDREAGDGDFGQNMEAAFGDVVTPVRGTDADVLNFSRTACWCAVTWLFGEAGVDEF